MPPLDTDEHDLLTFQIAHGIVRCPPGCADPEHERAREARRR